MSIITLLSDFGTKDYYVSAVKGSLLELSKELTIIDISHEITHYNIIESSFVLKNAYLNFPKESIHLIGVDSLYTPKQKHIVAKLNGHFFIGADNGVFSLLAKAENYDQIIEIEHPKSKISSFPMRDVFVDIAAQIVFKEKLENLGTPISTIKMWKKNIPDLARDNEIICHVLHVDQYGNLITDLTKEVFDKQRNNKKFNIIASSAKINKIYPTYSSFVNYKLKSNQRQKAGTAMAIFNSLNLLEIALYKSNPNHGGSAASLLGFGVGDSIRIEFTD